MSLIAVKSSTLLSVQLPGDTTGAVSSLDEDLHVAIAHATHQIHGMVARRIEIGRTLAVTKRID